MRAAAKVSGLGVFNARLRGVGPDHPVPTYARGIARPVTGFVSSYSASATDSGFDVSPVQKPCWGSDDWEFLGGEEALFVSSGGSMPRAVFGGAPTLKEAKEATTELKDVLEKLYLSKPTTPRSWLSSVLEIKARVTSENIGASTPSNYAIQAFRSLSENPSVQSVVTSIASDPNVWNAVQLNPALQEFLLSHKISKTNQYEKGSTDGDPLFSRSPRSVSPNSAESVPSEFNRKKWFMDNLQKLKLIMVDTLKLAVVDMMNSFSDYFENLFRDYYGDKKPTDAKGNTLSGLEDKALTGSLIGLAVMVIMLVVLKRV